MEQISKPHDRFFKEAFSRLETARDFLHHYLPDEITALLNLETLEITKDSFVNEELKGGVFLKVTALLMKHIFSQNIGEKLPGIFKLLQGILSARSGLQYLDLEDIAQ